MIGINEVAQKVVEKPQSSFDPSKRVGEVNGETKKTTYDPSKRVESNTETNKEGEKLGLTDEQKEILKSKTEWPDEIINNIGSMEEAEIYINANLQVAEINGKPCLIRTDIDLQQVDGMGRTNKQRMEQGLAPLDKNGKPIELHHIGQHADSPLAELTQQEHRSKDNFSILHDSTKETEIDREQFSGEKAKHWNTRSKEY
ncbi:HNH/ENDO VII family nuclease [Campylobacter sp.]|uniref:HNH/ENDO VII family nuclease n=1 Tax=Campylobacter sp. TaxID=205 RepID=UPI002A8120DA|nr:HNH/ENDO VII family nuclease [Campylobacter sp.]MDY4446073.1 HNH/ENDO VII family nuclease [Campylobacter sp.]